MQKNVPVIYSSAKQFHRLRLQELAETAATAKQAELSSALSEKAALVEGLQTEVRTTREAQVTVSNRMKALMVFQQLYPSMIVQIDITSGEARLDL